MNEDILNGGIKNGEVKAFEFIFKSHYIKLSLFANRFLNDLAVSEEIVADAFTYLWEQRESLVITGSVTSYMYKMVQNKSLNYIKHKKVENEYVRYLIRNNLIPETPDYDTNPYLEKELSERINAAIESLPDKCQEVFKLSRYENLKNKEIAQKLNISPKTVERHITIALDKMRSSLKHLVSVLFFAVVLQNL